MVNIIQLIKQELEDKFPALYKDAQALKKGDIMDVDNTEGQNHIIEERDDYAEDLKEKDDEGYDDVVDK